MITIVALVHHSALANSSGDCARNMRRQHHVNRATPIASTAKARFAPTLRLRAQIDKCIAPRATQIDAVETQSRVGQFTMTAGKWSNYLTLREARRIQHM